MEKVKNIINSINLEEKTYYEQKFISHVANLKELDDRTQIVSFKKAGTVVNNIEFIFRDNKLFVSGDLGCGIFSFSMCPRWNSDWDEIEIDYFVNKCKAFEGEKYLFDKEIAVKNVKEKMLEILYDEYTKAEAIDIANKVIKVSKGNLDQQFVLENDEILNQEGVNNDFLKQSYIVLQEATYSKNMENFRTLVISNPYSNQYKDYYACELSNIGKVINPTFKVWLYALKLAKEQLEKKLI